MRAFGLVGRSSPILWTVACLVATTGVAIGVDVLSVDTSDPQIQQFKAKVKSGAQPAAAAAAPDKVRQAVQGLKVPVLDLTKPPSLPMTSPAAKKNAASAASPAAAGVTVSADQTEAKNWYSITREYPDKKVTITISADLRIHHAPEGFVPSSKNKNTMQINPSPRGQKGEEFIAAQVTLYKFPNIPYVIDVECTKESRRICESKARLAKLVQSLNLNLIEAP
jgi:hypothetical protein